MITPVDVMKNHSQVNKTKQNKTKQNKTKQNKTKQNKTKQNKTKQNKQPQRAHLICSPRPDPGGQALSQTITHVSTVTFTTFLFFGACFVLRHQLFPKPTAQTSCRSTPILFYFPQAPFVRMFVETNQQFKEQFHLIFLKSVICNTKTLK